MAILNYWIGQIPAQPITININDENNTPVNLAFYTDISVLMLGSDNEEIKLDGSSLTTTGAASGRITFRFPTDRSLFNKEGTYLLQVRLSNTTALDYTDEQTIMVRRRGGSK